jgi:hypothetical protein
MRAFNGIVTAIIAALAVGGTTYLHGRMTERWTGRNVAAELQQAAEQLQRHFPVSSGDWELAEELESSPEELERAGAVGHVSRAYFNRKSKARLSVFVVCATPHDASGHTPDRCYPGAGFEIAETEHRLTVPLDDGRSAEVFTGTFRKSGQTLRVFWTYGFDGRWVAPQLARIELAPAKAVYKLYVIMDETPLPPGVGSKICTEFMSLLLPQFDAALKEATPSEQRRL